MPKSLGHTLSFLHVNRRFTEAAATGAAYGALLCWLSACLVASFHGAYLARPYWAAVPGLRTDTSGAIAFLIAAASLTMSEYLRLQRRHSAEAFQKLARSPRKGDLALQAVSETVATLSTGLVAYISVNAVTHPMTLSIQATHFASWPTEGTLRVLALLGCVASVGTLRYLHSGPTNAVGLQVLDGRSASRVER